MLRRITFLTIITVLLQFAMVMAASSDLIIITDAEQCVGAGIGYVSDSIDHRFMDELIPDPHKGPEMPI